MKVASGTVIAGRVEVEGEPLPDGTKVTLIAREDDETFELSAAEESEILAAIAEAERGETVDAAQLLESLPRRS